MVVEQAGGTLEGGNREALAGALVWRVEGGGAGVGGVLSVYLMTISGCSSPTWRAASRPARCHWFLAAPRTQPPELARDGARGSGRYSPLLKHCPRAPLLSCDATRKCVPMAPLRGGGGLSALSPFHVGQEAVPGSQNAARVRGAAGSRGAAANVAQTPDLLPTFSPGASSEGRASVHPG